MLDDEISQGQNRITQVTAGIQAEFLPNVAGDDDR